GLGALGLEVARDFARRGMRHLVLTGRRGLETPGARKAVAVLQALGARVAVAAVDVADRAALERVVAAFPVDLPLRAVVHAAVVLDDGLLADQTPGRFREVMAPKVLGAANLHALTAGADLDAFVLFSSMVGTLGNASPGARAPARARPPRREPRVGPVGGARPRGGPRRQAPGAVRGARVRDDGPGAGHGAIRHGPHAARGAARRGPHRPPGGGEGVRRVDPPRVESARSSVARSRGCRGRRVGEGAGRVARGATP